MTSQRRDPVEVLVNLERAGDHDLGDGIASPASASAAVLDTGSHTGAHTGAHTRLHTRLRAVRGTGGPPARVDLAGATCKRLPATLPNAKTSDQALPGGLARARTPTATVLSSLSPPLAPSRRFGSPLTHPDPPLAALCRRLPASAAPEVTAPHGAATCSNRASRLGSGARASGRRAGGSLTAALHTRRPSSLRHGAPLERGPVCRSFDAWIVGFGISTLRKDLRLIWGGWGRWLAT